MEHEAIRRFVQVRKLDAPHRLVVFEQTLDVLEAGPHRVAGLKPFLQQAIAHETASVALLRQYEQDRGSRSPHDDDAMPLDQRLGTLLGALNQRLRVSVRVAPPPDPEGVAATRLLQGVLPDGSVALTKQSFTAQFAGTRDVLARIEADPELVEAVDTLGHRALLDEIAALNETYGRALYAGPTRVAFDEVRLADVRGWEHLASLAARVSGAFPDPFDPAQADARRTLLDPLRRMEAADRARRRRSTSSTGMAPQTEPGETLEAPAAETAPEETSAEATSGAELSDTMPDCA